MEKWREKLKNKPVRYWIRDEIEEIMKEVLYMFVTDKQRCTELEERGITYGRL